MMTNKERERAIDEAVSMLNLGEPMEALKELRKVHDIVNRSRCKECSYTSKKTINCLCEICSGEMYSVVVRGG